MIDPVLKHSPYNVQLKRIKHTRRNEREASEHRTIRNLHNNILPLVSAGISNMVFLLFANGQLWSLYMVQPIDSPVLCSSGKRLQ